MTKIEKNWLEWVIFLIGLVLVIGSLGYLIYDAATASETPPQIEFKLGTPQLQSQNYILPIEVTNQGGQTAEDVQIEVVLENGGKEEESAELQIPFLPRRATQEGWVTFQTNPRNAQQIKTRAIGYKKP